MSKRSILIILLIILFSSSVFILNLTSIPILSNFAQQIARPGKSFLYSLKTTSQKDRDDKLQQENQELQKMLLDYERLKRDNLALRDQFETDATSKFKLLPARILGSQGSLLHLTALIIDKGERSGVEKGMAVVVKNNLLGKVESVSENYSKVNLINNEKFQTLGRTSETNALGVARGQGDFILFDQVAINESISKGQLLLTRGEINEKGFGIPPDFIIGKISEVDRNESLPSQSAKVDNIIDISRIDLVFVIIQ